MQQKIIETSLKMSLRLSFKLASGLALPFPVLRTAMEVGSTIFKPRADVWVKQIKLRDALDQRIVFAEVATPENEVQGVLLHCHGGAFFCRFISDTSRVIDRVRCTGQGQRIYAGLSSCSRTPISCRIGGCEVGLSTFIE